MNGLLQVWRLFAILALTAFLSSCQNGAAPSQQISFFEAEAVPREFLPRAKPEAVGVNPAALAALVAEAQNTHSAALIVIKDGRVVVERYFGHPTKQPLRINSVTKSIVSLAIGQLIADGKIPSLKTPLSRWFPEWALGEKAKITLRDIMAHTSGLYHEESATKLYQQPDVVRYARGLPLAEEPGKNFSYSNEAVALIPGIVLAASGKPLDIYLRDLLFKPMGISDYKWARDAAGNVLAFGGLWLLPRDLARIGQLMLDSGRWENKQLIPASWVHACTSPVRADIPDYGLLWRLYPGQREASAVPPGFGGDGWLGQYLVVYPKWRLVVVRLHAIEAGNDEKENRKYGFNSLQQMALALVEKDSDSTDGKSSLSKFKVAQTLKIFLLIFIVLLIYIIFQIIENNFCIICIPCFLLFPSGKK